MSYQIGFKHCKWVSLFLTCLLLLLSCSDGPNYAPVVDISDLGVFIQKKSFADLPVKPQLARQWVWPACGNVIATFSASNKGIDITGRAGEPVFASAAGTVVYSGTGLRGYGHLIIIKHNDLFLSAYAYNRVSLVRIGQRVQQRQKIAEMGMMRSKIPLLHFEIRHRGQAINPLTLLPAKAAI